MENQIEIWKDIPGYEGYYQVSSFGRVKSLERKSWNGFSWIRQPEKILKHGKQNSGYDIVNLSKKGIAKVRTVHQIVAITFLEHTPCRFKIVIDHKNGIKTDNRVENLQLISNRDNIIKSLNKKTHSSKYLGVTYAKADKKWRAIIRILGYNQISLGSFKDEYIAHLYYEKAFEIKHTYNGNRKQFIEKIKSLITITKL